MKLIATLATLAALVCQTEAGTATATIKVEHTASNIGHCLDEMTITAVTGTDAAEGKEIKVKLPDNFALEGTFAEATHVAGVFYEAALGANTNLPNAAAAEAGKITGLAYDADTNVVSFTLPVADVTQTATWGVTLKLKAVCNYLTTASGDPKKFTYTAKSAAVKFQLETADSSLIESTEAATTQPATNQVTEIAAAEVVEMPTNGATGKLKVGFTGIVDNSNKIQLNLPTGYKYAADCVCKIGPKDNTVAWDKITTEAATNEFTMDGTRKLTAVASEFECDKIKAPATITTPKLGDMSLKIGATAIPTHAAYFKTVTASPTKSPTAKAADSPASVATASGVVVGALGVAALFLA